MTNKKFVFFGTSQFGVNALKKLIAEDMFECLGVFTNPDRKVGRKQLLSVSPIKAFAKKLDVPVHQPQKLIDSLADFQNMQPDFGVVVSYGNIIPQKFIDVPPFGIINIHASLLPKYRGASPIQQAILDGESETGITIMQIDAGLDTGPILAQEKIQISPKDTTETLSKKLQNIGSELCVDTVKKLLSEEISGKEQDDSQAISTKVIQKTDGYITFQEPANAIEKKLRAYTPWPGIYSFINGQRIKIISLQMTDAELKNDPQIGILEADQHRLFIQTIKGRVEIITLQLEGKKAQQAADFINGNSELIGKKFDDTKRR